MGLSDIAAGIEVVEHQRVEGVAAVDRTGDDLAARLEPVADRLPCSAEAAADLVDSYAAGNSVGDSARAAGLAPMDGAKVLHLFGEQVSPLGPTGRRIVADYLSGELSRREARTLTGVGEAEFALATFIGTHDPILQAREAVEGVLTPAGDATVAKRDALAGTMSDADDLLQ